jgi:hypothetical protein
MRLTSSLLFALSICALLCATACHAEERVTYEDLWNDAITQPDAKIGESNGAILVTFQNNLTLYFFSKPNSTPHPAVVRWTLQRVERGYCSKMESWYFGANDGRQSFVNWLEAIKVKYDDFARRVGKKCPAPP